MHPHKPHAKRSSAHKMTKVLKGQGVEGFTGGAGSGVGRLEKTEDARLQGVLGEQPIPPPRIPPEGFEG